MQIKKFEKSLICKIITTEKYLNSKFNDFSNLESQSLLNKCGYSVGKEKNLSFKMRQNILLFIIKNHIMNIEQIKSHLSFLITMRKSDQTMEDAIQKWEQDINYIDSLKIAKKKVIVKVIKK